MGCSPCGCKELGTTEQPTLTYLRVCVCRHGQIILPYNLPYIFKFTGKTSPPFMVLVICVLSFFMVSVAIGCQTLSRKYKREEYAAANL